MGDDQLTSPETLRQEKLAAVVAVAHKILNNHENIVEEGTNEEGQYDFRWLHRQEDELFVAERVDGTQQLFILTPQGTFNAFGGERPFVSGGIASLLKVGKTPMYIDLGATVPQTTMTIAKAIENLMQEQFGN